MDRVTEKIRIGRLDECSDIKGPIINVSEQETQRKDIFDIPIRQDNPDPEKFRKTVEKTLELLENGENVTIVCQQGVSRSVSLAAAVIMKTENKTLRDAINLLERAHPISNPSDKMLDLLKRYAVSGNEV